jgi:hypothetical protein
MSFFVAFSKYEIHFLVLHGFFYFIALITRLIPRSWVREKLLVAQLVKKSFAFLNLECSLGLPCLHELPKGPYFESPSETLTTSIPTPPDSSSCILILPSHLYTWPPHVFFSLQVIRPKLYKHFSSLPCVQLKSRN